MNYPKKDLSIIITAHSEGLTAHKTMLSIQRAVKRLVQRQVGYEILVSIDSGDSETINYFKRYEDEPHYHLLHVSFKDLSTSRNNAVKAARGKYIAFLDADDLVSANWYDKALECAQAQEKVVVHPEYSITFGDDNLVWRKRDSGSLAFDTLCFVDNNLWDSPCLARREIFEQYPYVPNGNGFGYEDKQFHSQTLAAGYKHIVAPETVLFVRRKATGSMLRQANADMTTVAPNALISYQAIRKLDLSPYLSRNAAASTVPYGAHISQKSLSLAKHTAKQFHNYAKRYDHYNRLVQPIQAKRKERIDERITTRYPQWMIDEWKAMHHIDNTVFPSRDMLKTLPWYNADRPEPGVKYARLMQSFTKKPDTLFFIPWLIKGGADMLFINYSNELQRIHPDWQIAVLQTQAKDSVWAEKLTGSVDMINLHDIFQGLDFDTQYRLLATLITQNSVRRIIVGNSQLAYDFISRHQTLVKRLDITVYCYAFGEEFDDEGRLWGHIHTGIPRIYPVIHRIITDNQNTVYKLTREYAFDPATFSVHYQPTAAIVKKPVIKDRQSLRILWASRVCKQKRPDIIRAVANKLDPHHFIVDAYGQLEEDFTEQYFAGSLVHYKGAFNGSSALQTAEYDAYLYTSEGDGVPNMLQEITAAGLPIIASNVGGVGEFVQTGKTGYLIDDHNDIDAYVAAIKHLTDPSVRLKLVTGAQSLLKTQFSKTQWEKNISSDFDK